MTTNKRTAVVILNWNGADMLKAFLPQVIEACGEEGEVIVADNGSTDHSRKMMAEVFPHIKLISLSENYGFAEGYNRALAEVEAEFFLLLNSDVEPARGWLGPLVAYMDAHEEAAACCPKLLSYGERNRFEYAGAAGGYIDRLGYPFCRGRIFGDVEADRGQYDDTASVFWATGAALMIRRSDWLKSGGLDGRFFAHQEEIDLCWRLHRMGRDVACVPASKAWHVGGASLEQGNPRKTFLNFRNNLMMLYKNLPEGELKAVMRTRRWLDALAWLQFALKGDLKNAAAVRKARKAFKAMREELGEDRRRLAAEAVTDDVPGRLPINLLTAYHLKRRKTFSALVCHLSSH